MLTIAFIVRQDILYRREIRNFSNFWVERRNWPFLADADSLENDKRNPAFSLKFMNFLILQLLSCKRKVVVTSLFFGQHCEDIFQALHKNFNWHSSPLSAWMDKIVLQYQFVPSLIMK